MKGPVATASASMIMLVPACVDRYAMAVTTWPRTLTEDERAAILDDQLERFAWDGWQVLTRTPMTAQITRPKRISVSERVHNPWLMSHRHAGSSPAGSQRRREATASSRQAD